MKTKTISLLLSVFCLLFSGGIFAKTPPLTDSSSPKEWDLLGRRTVSWTVDHDEIVAVGQGTFTAVKIRLRGGPINMHRCVVHFGDGSQQEVELRSVIPMNGESRIINLEGIARRIMRVSLWYDTKNHTPRRAVIEVWGRH